jgi:hypothetical protein
MAKRATFEALLGKGENPVDVTQYTPNGIERAGEVTGGGLIAKRSWWQIPDDGARPGLRWHRYGGIPDITYEMNKARN